MLNRSRLAVYVAMLVALVVAATVAPVGFQASALMMCLAWLGMAGSEAFMMAAGSRPGWKPNLRPTWLRLVFQVPMMIATGVATTVAPSPVAGWAFAVMTLLWIGLNIAEVTVWFRHRLDWDTTA